jgi:hypothetical protein
MWELLSLLAVTFTSLLIHGGVGLVHVGGHIRAPAKPYESRVYGGVGACDLLCGHGSRIPYLGRGIRCGMRGILRVGVWCAIRLVSPLIAAVL